MSALDLFSLTTCRRGLTLLSNISWVLFVVPLLLANIFYPYNDSLGILNCELCCNQINNILFTYALENLLQISCKDVCIFCQSMCTIHFCFCQIVCLFVSKKASCSSNIIFDCCNPNHLYKYFIINVSNCYGVPHVFHRSTFQWWEEYNKSSL